MPRTILVVDDNDSFRGMLGSVFALRGYVAMVARTGTEGLELAASNAIDAALVDFEMPEMDGIEFCKMLQAQNKLAGKEVPMWIMTGALRPGVSRRATAAGVLVVVRKPFNIEEMCAQFEREFEERTRRPGGAAPGGAKPPGDSP